MYDRFLAMQINIEALFGSEAVGLFSGLWNYCGNSLKHESGNNGNELFVFLVTAYVQ